MEKIKPDYSDSSHFVKLPYDIFGRVSPRGLAVYAGFRKYADHLTGRTTASVETVASFIRVDKKTVEAGIRELKRAKWMKRKRQGLGKPCVTTLKIPPIAVHQETPQSGALSEPVTRTEKPNSRISYNIVDFKTEAA